MRSSGSFDLDAKLDPSRSRRSGFGETKHSEACSPREWAKTVWEVYGGLAVTLDDATSFSGVLHRRAVGGLQMTELCLSPQTYERTASMIKSHPSHDVFVTMVVEGRVTTIQEGRSCLLGPGDIVLVESGRPYTSVVQSDGRLIDFALPRGLAGLSEHEVRCATGRAFAADSALGRWLGPTLIGFYRMGEGVSPVGAERLADAICGLLTTAVLELHGADERLERWRVRFEEVAAFIDEHLDDIELSVDTIVRNFFMSKRSVYRLFARFDTTVAAVIRGRRLEAARMMMLSKAHSAKPLSFIASRYGFSSLHAFSRAFATEYGMRPSAYRAAHRA